MIALMLPFFFLAMYEKDGQTAEKIVRNYIMARYARPPTRPYKTENLYLYLMKGATTIGKQGKTTEKTAIRKRPASKA
jgi:hypothetical protein